MSLVHWIVAGGAILIGISAIIFLIIGLRRNATHHQIKRKTGVVILLLNSLLKM